MTAGVLLVEQLAEHRVLRRRADLSCLGHPDEARIAARLAWLRAATVTLAMVAGGIGGAVVLLIQRWVS